MYLSQQCVLAERFFFEYFFVGFVLHIVNLQIQNKFGNLLEYGDFHVSINTDYVVCIMDAYRFIRNGKCLAP